MRCMRCDNEKPADACGCDGYGTLLLRARPSVTTTRAAAGLPLAAAAE